MWGFEQQDSSYLVSILEKAKQIELTTLEKSYLKPSFQTSGLRLAFHFDELYL